MKNRLYQSLLWIIPTFYCQGQLAARPLRAQSTSFSHNDVPVANRIILDFAAGTSASQLFQSVARKTSLPIIAYLGNAGEARLTSSLHLNCGADYAMRDIAIRLNLGLVKYGNAFVFTRLVANANRSRKLEATGTFWNSLGTSTRNSLKLGRVVRLSDLSYESKSAIRNIQSINEISSLSDGSWIGVSLCCDLDVILFHEKSQDPLFDPGLEVALDKLGRPCGIITRDRSRPGQSSPAEYNSLFYADEASPIQLVIKVVDPELQSLTTGAPKSWDISELLQRINATSDDKFAMEQGTLGVRLWSNINDLIGKFGPALLECMCQTDTSLVSKPKSLRSPDEDSGILPKSDVVDDISWLSFMLGQRISNADLKSQGIPFTAGEWRRCSVLRTANISADQRSWLLDICKSMPNSPSAWSWRYQDDIQRNKNDVEFRLLPRFYLRIANYVPSRDIHVAIDKAVDVRYVPLDGVQWQAPRLLVQKFGNAGSVSLPERSPRKYLQRIIDSLHGIDGNATIAAVGILAKTQNRNYATVIESLCDAKDLNVRWAALQAMVALHYVQYETRYTKARDEFSQLGPLQQIFADDSGGNAASLRIAKVALGSDDFKVRGLAALVLGRSRRGDFRDILRALSLKDPSAYVQLASQMGLFLSKDIQTMADVEALKNYYRSGNSDARNLIIRTIDWNYTEERSYGPVKTLVWPILYAGMHDPDETVRISAFEASQSQGSRALLPYLIEKMAATHGLEQVAATGAVIGRSEDPSPLVESESTATPQENLVGSMRNIVA